MFQFVSNSDKDTKKKNDDSSKKSSSNINAADMIAGFDYVARMNSGEHDIEFMEPEKDGDASQTMMSEQMLQMKQTLMGFKPNDEPALKTEAYHMGTIAAESEMSSTKYSNHAKGTLHQNNNNVIYITAIYSEKGTPYSDGNFDTLFSIAKRFGITVDDLLNANPGINPNNLLQGQKIILPNNISSENNNLSNEDLTNDQPSGNSDQFVDLKQQLVKEVKSLSSNSELFEAEKQNRIADLFRKIEEKMMGSGDPTAKWIMGNGEDWKTRPADFFEQWILDNNWDMEELNRIIGILGNPAHGYTNRNTVTKDPDYSNYVELPEFQQDTTSKSNKTTLKNSSYSSDKNVSKEEKLIEKPVKKTDTFINENGANEKSVRLSYKEERYEALNQAGIIELYYNITPDGKTIYTIVPISGPIIVEYMAEDLKKYENIIKYAEKR